MKIKANLLNKPVNFQMDDCQIEKVVELPRDQFSALVITPLTNQPFIAENKRWMFADDSAVHCLLVLGQGSGDGVLIYSAGYDYPRLAAYLPGMRDILNARLERAADFIVHQGTEATENGSWSISFKELEKQTEITVRRGNGLDGMLLEALTHRREVTSAALTDTGIDTAYHLNFCSRIPGQKPCYFTKLPEEQKTQLFYEAVETLLDFFGDENLYGVLHNGLQMPNEEILARGYLTTEAMLAAGTVMSLPENSGISLRDVLQYELTEDLSLVHAQGGEPVPLEQEEELTRTERKRFSDVLDAHVLESRAGEHGTELVIGGVKPERLERFRPSRDAPPPADPSRETIPYTGAAALWTGSFRSGTRSARHGLPRKRCGISRMWPPWSRKPWTPLVGRGKPPSKHLRITVEFPCGRSPRIVSARRCGTFSVSRPESSWQSWTSKMTHSTAPAGFRGRNTASRSPE